MTSVRTVHEPVEDAAGPDDAGPRPDVPDPVHDLATTAVERATVWLSPDAGGAARARSQARLDDARRAAALALAAGAPLGLLAARAGLDRGEAELLALLVGTEHDERLQRLVVALTEDRERHRVELWLLPHLLPGTGPALAGPSSGLVRAALVELLPRGAFGRTALRLAPRVLWALWGDDRPDPDLPVAAALVATGPGAADAEGELPDAVLVVGPDRVERRRIAARALGTAALLTSPLPGGDAGWAALVREATLHGVPVLLEADGALDETGRRWVEAAGHLSVALSTQHALALDDLPRRDWCELSSGAGEVSAQEWLAVTGQAEGRPPALRSEQLELMAVALRLSGGDLPAAHRRLTHARITTVAARVVPRARWGDLVLPDSRMQRLRDLVDRYRSSALVYGEWGVRPNPSRGLVALFAGSSGTGKTMAAEVVAGELGLDMYQLDLSAVVSKYIGETEKNLDELFEAASLGGTLLFFDEADAMFGKRTEVSDAHDRYANVGTSYLLQRLERYDGVVVLATNFEKNIDEAFVRRVHVRVDFPVPAAAERVRLWRQYLDVGIPLAGDADLDWLVGFELSGASIRNTVVDAAFLAARDGVPVAMEHLARGVAREMHKSSRLVRRDVFGPWFDVASRATGG